MFGVTDVTLVFGDEQCQVSQHSSAALAARVTQICKSAILATKSCGPSLICFFLHLLGSLIFGVCSVLVFFCLAIYCLFIMQFENMWLEQKMDFFQKGFLFSNAILYSKNSKLSRNMPKLAIRSLTRGL